MKINGRGFQDHIRLLAPLFALIAAVWALRLVLDLAGVPLGVVRFFSVTVAGAVSLLLTVLLIHLKRFGGYANIIVAAVLLSFWQQFLIVAAIAFSALTHTQNVYTLPEFSGHLTLAQHILGHLTFGLVFETLFGAAMDCLLLWLLRRIVAEEGTGRGA